MLGGGEYFINSLIFYIYIVIVVTGREFKGQMHLDSKQSNIIYYKPAGNLDDKFKTLSTILHYRMAYLFENLGI